MAEQSETTPSSVNLGYHLVVYIDLPGQRRELEKIRRVPKTEEEKAAATEAIANSAMRVKLIRDDLTLQAKQLMQVDPSKFDPLPPPLKEAFLRYRDVKFKHVGFSDTFVIAMSLAPGNGPEGTARAVTAIWAMLAGTASVALLAAARKIPLRGGMTVGTAVDLFENEAYGAALMDAYRLESEFAEYNRIAIGQELLDYLDEIDEFVTGSTIFDNLARQHATKCRELICLAPDDGLPMVHMLAPYIMSQQSDTLGGTWQMLWSPCREWIESEAQRFAAARDYKLAARYTRLLRYFDAYKPSSPTGDKSNDLAKT